MKMTSPILHFYSKKQDWGGIVKKSIMGVTVDFNSHSFFLFPPAIGPFHNYFKKFNVYVFNN